MKRSESILGKCGDGGKRLCKRQTLLHEQKRSKGQGIQTMCKSCHLANAARQILREFTPNMCHLRHSVCIFGYKAQRESRSNSLVTNEIMKQTQRENPTTFKLTKNNRRARMSGSNSNKKNEPTAIPKKSLPSQQNRDRLSFLLRTATRLRTCTASDQRNLVL